MKIEFVPRAMSQIIGRRNADRFEVDVQAVDFPKKRQFSFEIPRTRSDVSCNVACNLRTLLIFYAISSELQRK